jgi:hypothetical protein
MGQHDNTMHPASNIHDIPADVRRVARTYKSPEGWSGVGFFFYSQVGGEMAINGPIACSSKMINCLVASVGKAESIRPTDRSVQKNLAKLIRIDNTVHQFHKILLPNLTVSAFFSQRASLAAPLLLVGSL